MKWRIYARESTPLDKWCAKFWKKLGVKVKMNQDVPTSSILIIMNDYVLMHHFPRQARKDWDKIYSVKNVKDADMDKMTETLLNIKHKSVLTIIKDKEIANRLREI